MSTHASVVLGGYPAKQCARAVHNDYSPASPPKPKIDRATQKLFDAGNEFEAKINERLGHAPGAVVLSDEAGWNANIEATLAAMRSCVPMIVNGRLPRAGDMAGAPDVLVRIDGGYVPVDVKLHGTRKNAIRSSLSVSSLTDPSQRRRVKGLSDAGWSVEGDGFQLAHYTRMLQHLGFHAGDDHLIGGIIGQSDYSDLGGDPWLIAWYDLGTPRRDTFSTSTDSGRAKRSLLERYDHEFAFRVQVATEARAGGELVRPFNTNECGWCVWRPYCSQAAGPDDASFSIQAGLPIAQQWRYLYDAGATTVDDLAALDPDRCPEGWSPRDSQPGSRAERKYATLVRRARMAAAGIEIEPLSEWPPTPSADVEIDFDIEWDFENRIYLWGLRVRQGQDDTTALFNPVVSYEPLDDVGEAALAAEFAERLRTVVIDAETAGRTVRIFHWSDPERSRTRKYPAIDELLEGRAFDLFAWFNRHFLTRKGGSIKAVAPIFGFEWAVEDAGGAQSQVKVDLARAGGAEALAASEWLHHYNESDVAAQAAIRDGLSLTIANREGRVMEIFYTVTESGAVVFAERSRAEAAARILDACETAKTWGDFRSKVTADELAEIVEIAVLGEEQTQDELPFDADVDVPGYADGDYPTWLQAEMLDWFPKELAAKYGDQEASVFSGDYLELPGEKAEEIAQDLRALGHTVERSSLYFH